ncbi:hypothetical protein H7I53_09185 [Mycolicibacterium pulveris]|uniref:Secreted protein n=1 Tax=Mycolicibacterium pulveris TaxID=36813 RepID=A0A7I7UKI5_MYCPV|nr:hypothetical protein [Mycolicibacterium pulveris]MCV6980396.1 hypothetical protein [Mycolicibacterium pulveris]BBY81787.1 hypothetical protein MPUL_29450 [Mycolicibacterium pulveris]
MRRNIIALVTAAALVSAPAVAAADPAAPQPNTPCPADLSDAATVLPDAMMPLICRDGRWQPVTTPQPPNDRWLSYGPEITLRGQGKRNPEVAEGAWTATPRNPESSCRAALSEVVSAGVVGPPQVTEGQPGQPLSITVPPRMFEAVLSGDCLWQKAG